MATNDSCFKFDVVAGSYRVVSACGMSTLDALELWRQACPNLQCEDDGTDCWIKMQPNGTLISITETHNPLIVETPGQYKLMFTGPVNANVSVCVGDPYFVNPTMLSAGV
ncbi:MAG: hypothetical protein RL260_3644 [Pseudomonadota bacterium]|jgi:hypothetical protein